MFRHVASFLANGVVPRGPVMGFHVVPWQWFIGSKFYGVRGDRTLNLPLWQCFGSVWATTSPDGGPYIAYVFYYI